jgi:histidinol-phosphate aminotransferase
MIAIRERERPKVVIIASPNNPTGNRIDSRDLKRFLDTCRDTIVMIDEAYWGFGSTENSYVKPYIDEYPNLIICRTFSKYFGLAGIRIGFAFAGKNLGVLTEFAKRYLGFNRISERLGEIALDNMKYYTKVGRQYEKDKELMYREFSKLRGFTPFRSFANFVLVDVPAEIRTELKCFLTERNLFIKFLDEPGFRTEVRISLGTREQNWVLVRAIKEFCRTHPY